MPETPEVSYVKFMFLRRPQKLQKSSQSIWQSVKLTVKISSILVAFLENTDFIN